MFDILFVVFCTLSHAFSQSVIHGETDYYEIKCLVCEQIMKEVQRSVAKINPDIKIDVGGYRLDTNPNRKKIEYRKSEGYLTELMENICEKMDNFVKAKHRKTGDMMVIPLISENGQMNPLMSEIDVVQDENLNKNLKIYCENILENYDEKIVNHLQISESFDSLTSEICELVCKEKLAEKDEL